MSITRKQFMLFMFIVQTGSVFILFQRPFIDKAGRDAWVMFIAASVFHYMLLFLYERNYQYFLLKRITAVLYILYWLFISVFSIAFVEYTLSEWAFPKTPPAVVIFLMVLVSLYCNLCKDEVSVNLGAFLIFLIVLFMLFLSMAFDQFEWTYLFPIGEASMRDWGGGLFLAQYPFIGVEIYMIFRSYLEKGKSMKGWPMFIYNLIWSGFFLFTIVITLLFFPLKEINLTPAPIMYILKSQHVTFVERLDLFFIYIWMTWSVITITIISFTALFTFRKTFQNHAKKAIYMYHFLLFVLSLSFTTKKTIEYFQDYILYVHLVFVYAIPFVIILYYRRQKI